MAAQPGLLILRKRAAIVVAAFALAAVGQSLRAAEPSGNTAPPKPIIRNLKFQTPVPAYRETSTGKTARVEKKSPGTGTAAANRTGTIPAQAKYSRAVPPVDRVQGSGSTSDERETRPTARLKMPLQGSVVVNVPKTPEDVATYLMHMKSVIHDYERVAVDTLLGGGGININAATIETSRGQSLELIRRIRMTTPPRELTVAHNQLADTMAAVGDFLERPGGAAGGGLAALTQLQPLLGRLHGSLDRYHSGVTNCIAYYGLSPDLDPFNGEDDDAKRRLTDALQGMTGSLMNPPSASVPSPEKSANSPLPGFGAGSMGALGGIDLNALQGLLGGMDLSALKGGLGGAGGSGGLDFSKLGAMDRLGNLSGQELDVLKQLMGPSDAGGSTSPGLQLDGQSADMLMNTLKQLQGQ